MRPDRKLVAAAIIGWLIGAACGTIGPTGADAGFNSQEAYAFAGCEDAGSYGCPNDQVLACALTTIRAKYDECQQAGDCVVAPVQNCIGVYNSCPPAAVNDAGRAAFLAEAAIEVDRYCDGGLCRSSPSCAFSYQQGRVDCVNGRCVAQPDADAGT